MNKRKFLVTVSTEADEFNESDFSVKEAIYIINARKPINLQLIR